MINKQIQPKLTIPCVNNSAYMWAVFHGQLYDSGYIVAVYDTKRNAEKDIRREGYKFNKKQELFINNDDPVFGDCRWYRIDKIEHNTLS